MPQQHAEGVGNELKMTYTFVGKSTPGARQAVVKHLVTQMIHFF